MNISQKLTILTVASLVVGMTSTTAIARGNVSDIGGGNVSDIGGGNVSDIGGGNVSDNGGGNVSDPTSLDRLATDLGAAYESCQGGAGCSAFYSLYEQALDLLDYYGSL